MPRDKIAPDVGFYHWCAGMKSWAEYWDAVHTRLIGAWQRREHSPLTAEQRLDGLIFFGTMTEAVGSYATFFKEHPDSPPVGLTEHVLNTQKIRGHVKALQSMTVEDMENVLGYGNVGFPAANEVEVPEVELRTLARTNATALHIFSTLAASWYEDLGFRHAFVRLKHHGGLIVQTPVIAPESDLKGLGEVSLLVLYNPYEGLHEPLLLPYGDRIFERMLSIGEVLLSGLDEIFGNRIACVKTGQARLPPDRAISGVRAPAHRLEPWKKYRSSLSSTNLQISSGGHSWTSHRDWLQKLDAMGDARR